MPERFHRAVVTGRGAVSPFGSGVDVLWDGLVQGQMVCAPIARFPVDDLVPAVGGEVPGEWRDPDRAGEFAEAAAVQALQAAGLDPATLDPMRVGVAVGTTLGGMHIFERWLQGEVSPCDRVRIPYFAPAVRLARWLGAAGPVATPQLACASGTAALALAARWIETGRCDVVLAGGTDLLCRFVVAGFNSLRATATRACPFDAEREGLVLGEGAGMLVVEAESTARGRGAALEGVLSGWAMAGDATHMTAPDREGRGAAVAMARALAHAGIDAEQVGFVSAHGTGTRYNDAMEAHAIASVFGAGAVPVHSIKGAIGHTLGAAGAIEAIVCIESVRRGVVPATAGLERLAPDCAALDVVQRAPRALDRASSLSTSSGFAGANAALVLEGP